MALSLDLSARYAKTRRMITCDKIGDSNDSNHKLLIHKNPLLECSRLFVTKSCMYGLKSFGLINTFEQIETKTDVKRLSMNLSV